MRWKIKGLVAILVTVLSFSAQGLPSSGRGTWETSLLARDLNLDGVTDAYYDKELGVTWLTQRFSGRAYTIRQNVENFVLGRFDDWRLPKNDLSCADRELRCTGNEMAYLLLNEFGGSAGTNLYASGHFLNFSPAYYLEDRSMTGEISPSAFSFDRGESVSVGSTFRLSGFAVRDGDVLVVPEPETLQLLMAGLVFMGIMRRTMPPKTPKPPQ